MEAVVNMGLFFISKGGKVFDGRKSKLSIIY